MFTIHLLFVKRQIFDQISSSSSFFSELITPSLSFWLFLNFFSFWLNIFNALSLFGDNLISESWITGSCCIIAYCLIVLTSNDWLIGSFKLIISLSSWFLQTYQFLHLMHQYVTVLQSSSTWLKILSHCLPF